MSRRWLFFVAQFAAVGLCTVVLTSSAAGQGLRTVIESRDKVFPGESAGVTAIKRDSSGRYYILAKTATAVSIYGPDGTLIDRIPNSKSNGATIRYAVDIDISPDGMLAVADRGANAIEVFGPDGTLAFKVPISAPTSIVALPDNQFAVTSLISNRLVQIIDQKGRVVRTFGDPGTPGEQPTAEKEPFKNWGRISGDSAGGIYFAFTSLPDPTLRKYDRYGYVGYETSLPEKLFAPGQDRPNDRIEFTLGFSDTSLSQQTSGFVTFGSSGDVKFGGGVGTGFAEALRRGFGYGQVIQGLNQPGAGGSFGATFSGEVTNKGTDFQLGMGRMSGFGGRGRRFGGGTFADQATSQGGLLQFSTGDEENDATSDPSGSYSSQYSGNTAELGMFGSTDFGGGNSSGVYTGTPGAEGLAGGLPASFVFGSAFNTVGFRPRGLGGGAPDLTTGAAAGATAGRDHATPAAGGAGAAGGTGHFSYHGRHGTNTPSFTATMKVNLGDLGRVSASDKPVITAMAIDPETQEIWAGIGDTLVHFSKDGNPAGIYYLMLTSATAVKPTALLVEANRILIATDPWGIFEFPRPDKPNATPKQQLNVVPQVVSQPQP